MSIFKFLSVDTYIQISSVLLYTCFFKKVVVRLWKRFFKFLLLFESGHSGPHVGTSGDSQLRGVQFNLVQNFACLV